MTPDGFRRLALSLPDTSEVGHMGHPDFRRGGRIFATLGYPDGGWGMVKLTPEQQQAFVDDDPETFTPLKNAWGDRGCTNVKLGGANVTKVTLALAAAWENLSPKAKARKAKKTRGRKENA
jgi:hypothetical protein